MNPIIDPHHLVELISDPNLVLICAGSSQKDRELFNHQHLHGSIYVDLNKDLSKPGPDPAKGGRHPLPPIEEFTTLIGSYGIGPESTVVVFDYNYGANAAARFWWMMRAVGHEKVQVINGGPDAAAKAGFQTDSQPPDPHPKVPYPAKEWLLPVVELTGAEAAAKSPETTLIDVRSPERYFGKSEPIDLVAGHIPGAINIPFAKNLDDQGFFLPPAQIRELYKTVSDPDNLNNCIIHCGSGVTACHTILAMDYAGLKMPALYVGSWSEWSRCNKPISTQGQ